jgi:amino acid transporter
MADFTKRFRRDHGAATNAPDQSGGDVAVDERSGQPLPPAPPPQGEPVASPSAATRSDDTTASPPPVRDDRREAVRDDRPARATAAASARDAYGGINWGSAFFGWLVAVGIGALLTALLAGAGTALGLTDAATSGAARSAETIGLGGGILLLAVSLVAYYSGGYVAGRMSRFDGARQGLGVWLLGLIFTVAIAAAGWIFGDKYNVLDRLDLPRIPANASDLTTGGLIVLGAIALGTLLAAIVGGTVGRRYHDKVDRAEFATDGRRR